MHSLTAVLTAVWRVTTSPLAASASLLGRPEAGDDRLYCDSRVPKALAAGRPLALGLQCPRP